MGNWLFKRVGGSVNQPAQPATSMRVQTSVEGKPIPFGYGKQRIPVNIIFQGIFLSYPPTQSGGGGKNTSGFGNATNTLGNYTYSIWTQMALCEGPINTSNNPAHVWWNKAEASFDRAESQFPLIGIVQGYFGFTYFRGTYSQTASSVMTSTLPGNDLNYRGIVYVESTPMYLGTSAEYPNITIDVEFALSRAISGSYGADPRDIISDFLSNTHYGVGFPSARYDTNASYSNYCKATGIVLSPFIADQRPASDWMQEWAQTTNSEFIWTGGVLKVIPYGDQTFTANGSTYTAPSILSTSLTDADYIVSSSSDPNEPMLVERKRIEDQVNKISVEYLSGENGTLNFDPAAVDAKDDAGIELYGLRPKSTIQMHAVTEAAAATLSAQLLLGREQILNKYTFTVSSRYILLDPMDIISITDNVLGIQSLPVRIKEVTENEDYSLTIVAEDYLAGTANSPAVAKEPNAGDAPNYNVDPGNTAVPMLFEPTDALAGGLFVWGAVTGESLDNWGGCEVWSSSDGTTYIHEGTIQGQSRVGVTTAILPTATEAASGLTFDTSSTLSVDLTSSQGTLQSVTHNDLLALATLCYLDGEFIAYQTSTPTGTYTTNLTTLVRGAYDSPITEHASGVSFCRIDNGIFKVPFTADRVGQTIYLKFLSFNKYGGGRQGLADVGAHTYTIQGTALASPLPNVTDFNSVYTDNVFRLGWTEITDFRSPILYEIRKGTDWDSALFLGRFAHPPIPTLGDGVYWIKAFCTPVTGLEVYSENADDLLVDGSVIPLNVKASFDEIATGAPGTFSSDIS